MFYDMKKIEQNRNISCYSFIILLVWYKKPPAKYTSFDPYCHLSIGIYIFMTRSRVTRTFIISSHKNKGCFTFIFYKKYFYDKKDLGVFYFHVTIYEKIIQLLFFLTFPVGVCNDISHELVAQWKQKLQLQCLPIIFF